MALTATEGSNSEIAKLVVTSSDVLSQRRTAAALRKALPESKVTRYRNFRAVFLVEAMGDPCELAEKVSRECARSIGRVVPVLAEVESRLELVKLAAVEIGVAQVGGQESFGFRLHKRGAHGLEKPTLDLEREIGGAIWVALEQRDGTRPKVDLESPDIQVSAEVLGPTTSIGIVKQAWR